MIFLTSYPKSPKIQHKIIRDEIKKRLKPVAKQATKSRAKVVGNWKNKPQFESEISVTAKIIKILVTVRRAKRIPGTNITVADLWKWIDRTGTKAHPITPKKPGGILAFQGGDYQAKTGASPARFGGPGKVANPTPVFTRSVNHPGFKPRHFSKAIDKDINKDFQNAIKSGYKSGFKKHKP